VIPRAAKPPKAKAPSSANFALKPKTQLEVEIHKRIANETGELIYPEANLTLDLPNKSGVTQTRPVRLERADGWADPIEIQGKYLEIAIPVGSVEEGFEVFTQIARHMPDVLPGEIRPPARGKVAFEIKGRVYAYVKDGELRITFPNGSDKVAESNAFLQALISSNMKASPK
jgi:hypothetical protein